jgi:hypothetical protein
VHEWKVRSSPWYVRREVKKRDKGMCRLCGVNVVKAHREWTRAKPPAGDRAARKRWRAARPHWEADHIVPVADGAASAASTTTAFSAGRATSASPSNGGPRGWYLGACCRFDDSPWRCAY